MDKLLRHPFPADYMDPKQHRRCFNCGDERHSIKFCPKGAFICFKCHEEGHVAKQCRSHLRPVEKKIDLSDSETIFSNSKVLASFGILTITEGSPSLELIKLRLGWFFNWQRWSGKVFPLQANSFLIEFPSVFQLSEAVDIKTINFEIFKGCIAPWNENFGMKTIDSSFYQWIKFKNLPLQFWSTDIIAKIVGTFGEMIKCCKNISEKLNGQDVRILVKIKSADCIPQTILCSYMSQVDSFTREVKLEINPIGVGQQGSDVIGKHLSSMEAQGDIVLESQWIDQVSAPVKSTPIIDQIHPSKLLAEKGKCIMEKQNFLNSAESKGFHKDSPCKESFQNFENNNKTPNFTDMDVFTKAKNQEEKISDSSESIPDSFRDFPLDLVKQTWKGRSFFIERSTWEAFIGGKGDSSNSISATVSFPQKSNQTPALQPSLSIPPGFSQKAASSSTSRSSRKIALSQKHRSFLKLASSSKTVVRSVKKGARKGSVAQRLSKRLEHHPISRENV
ncbi:uncharacterized protein LOC109822964 isoform X1 [Asparagus officinalis]|uniref:uncharacterized protein LOC109822964 isoform X1 n=1 Tax=Asparagus officinalis TaxID=4686 RepID=UPI00098E4971|nr:uncharacterized protein LOC109822964 isoform X1 [Asparagus officinalis]